MPTTLPSLGSLQSNSRKPANSGSSDEGIVALDVNYGISPDGRDFYARHKQSGRQGWRQLNPNDPKDRELIDRARQILSQISRESLKKTLSDALKNSRGKEVLKKVQREGKPSYSSTTKSSTTKSDELAAKFGVPKPRAKDPGPQPNNSSSFSATGAFQGDEGDLDANQGPTNTSEFDELNSPESQLADESQTSLSSGKSSGESWGDLAPDSDVQPNQTKLPYQPKPDGGSQLPPLGSLREGSYPKDSWKNESDGTNDGFPKNNRVREEPDREKYRPQWREEEGKSQEESGDEGSQSGEQSDIPNRGVSGSTPGGGSQQTNRSLGSRIADYKDKFSQFTKNFGNAGQQTPLTNKLGQAANKASQTLQKARQAAQTAKQAAQVAKLGVRVGVQLIRVLLPLLIPILKILLIILIVIVLLLMVIAAVGSILRPLFSPPPPTERSRLDEEVPVSSFIEYIVSDGFDFNDPRTNFMVNGQPRFGLLPRDNERVQAVLQLIRDNASLRSRINRLLREGVYIKTNERSPYVSGLDMADPSADNRIILRIAWMWVENDWASQPPSLGPDWYLHNCNDRPNSQYPDPGPAGISPRKYDLSDYCGVYGSGQHQIAGFQLGDRAKEGKIVSAYNFCFKKEFPVGAGQVMQENFNYSSNATREAWKYTNPVYAGKMPFLSNLNQEFLITDFYTGANRSCTSQACEARTQLLVKHPCMAMYLNTAADSWVGFDGNRGGGNAQVIVSALHYYILDLKAGAS